MRHHRFEFRLGLLFIALWSAVWLWQNPGALGDRVRPADVERYVSVLETAAIPPDQRAELARRVRTWLASDDGRPVYMLNLLRYYNELLSFPGAPTDAGTPVEANRRYEAAAGPLLLARGGYPQYAGVVQGPNLFEAHAGLDHWDRVLLVRYPNRRAFMEVITDPKFLAVVRYKFAALSVTLTPTSVEMTIPDLSWLCGALLLIAYLSIGWRRAARRAPAATEHSAAAPRRVAVRAGMGASLSARYRTRM
ncbi:MAG: hypothetical protein HY899_01120 [Deltaproteobacteria bacterium]|nr:hypothetical protein [Deltaproteobacteria bacterium]